MFLKNINTRIKVTTRAMIEQLHGCKYKDNIKIIYLLLCYLEQLQIIHYSQTSHLYLLLTYHPLSTIHLPNLNPKLIHQRYLPIIIYLLIANISQMPFADLLILILIINQAIKRILDIIALLVTDLFIVNMTPAIKIIIIHVTATSSRNLFLILNIQNAIALYLYNYESITNHKIHIIIILILLIYLLQC